MKYSNVIKVLLSLLIVVLPSLTYGQEKTLVRETTYKAGESDSKISCREKAITELRNRVLTEIGVFVYSETIMNTKDIKGVVTSDFLETIRSISAGLIKVKITEETWNGEVFWMKANITVDESEIRKSIEEISTKRNVKLFSGSESPPTKSVDISGQIWTTQNLNVSNFSNGDPIMEAVTDVDWERARKNHIPAWCYYDNDPHLGKTFGKLYNWFVASDPRGVCPTDWHVPTDQEWGKLIDNIGGASKAGEKLKSVMLWSESNGVDTYGFSGIPGGYRVSSIGDSFFGINNVAYFWSATEYDKDKAWNRILRDLSDKAYGVQRLYDNKGDGNYVRCIKN